MNKYFLTFACIAVMAISLSAQKLPKSVKDAKKALNAKNFSEALNLINVALEDEATANISEAWSVKGDALIGLLDSDYEGVIKSRIPGAPPFEIKNAASAPLVFDAYKMALDKAVDDKDKGKKGAIAGLANLAIVLNELGLELFNNKKFGEAYNSFNAIISSREALNAIGNKSIFAKEEDFNTMQYYTALAATYAGTPEKAIDISKRLVELNFNKPLPYEQLFESLVATDEEAAFAILAKGRKACSDDPKNMEGFLLKEINFLLKKEDYSKLESKLQEAIASDPDNFSLYYALGNVYSQLSKEQYEAKNAENGLKYFNEASKYYAKTLEIKPDHVEAMFNQGVLHHSKATRMNTVIQELSSDYSSAGTDKYNALQNEQKQHLKAAKPYFEKALTIDAKHYNSVNALKGISAHLNDKEGIAKYDAMLKALEK
ncbi:MAG: tetratricopeptide (TPR) repeat protein [Maribacter sp.]|jgi:tetratricopeptide (TPR) repeat protein